MRFVRTPFYFDRDVNAWDLILAKKDEHDRYVSEYADAGIRTGDTQLMRPQSLVDDKPGILEWVTPIEDDG